MRTECVQLLPGSSCDRMDVLEHFLFKIIRFTLKGIFKRTQSLCRCVQFERTLFVEMCDIRTEVLSPHCFQERYQGPRMRIGNECLVRVVEWFILSNKTGNEARCKLFEYQFQSGFVDCTNRLPASGIRQVGCFKVCCNSFTQPDRSWRESNVQASIERKLMSSFVHECCDKTRSLWVS